MAIIIDLRGRPLRRIPILSNVREVEKLKNHVVNNGALFIPPYRYDVPKLPEWMNKVYNYKQYKLIPYNLSCSCEWWENKRRIYPEGDLRLVCKHLYYKITSTPKLLKTIDDLTLMLIKSYLFHGENMLLKAVLGKDKLTFYLGARYYSDWYNVYAQAEDKWKRYSYTMFDRRWSYNEVPPNDDRIISHLKNYEFLFKKYLNEV